MNLVPGQGVWGIGGHAVPLPNQRTRFEFQDFFIIFVLQMGAYSFEDDTP